MQVGFALHRRRTRIRRQRGARRLRRRARRVALRAAPVPHLGAAAGSFTAF